MYVTQREGIWGDHTTLDQIDQGLEETAQSTQIRLASVKENNFEAFTEYL